MPASDVQQAVIGCQQNIRPTGFRAGDMERIHAGKPELLQLQGAGDCLGIALHISARKVVILEVKTSEYCQT